MPIRTPIAHIRPTAAEQDPSTVGAGPHKGARFPVSPAEVMYARCRRGSISSISSISSSVRAACAHPLAKVSVKRPDFSSLSCALLLAVFTWGCCQRRQLAEWTWWAKTRAATTVRQLRGVWLQAAGSKVAVSEVSVRTRGLVVEVQPSIRPCAAA